MDPVAGFLSREQNILAGFEEKLEENSEDIAVEEVEPTIEQNVEEPFKVAEKIQKWREEQKAGLKKKDEEEVLKKENLRQQAIKELEDWYHQHEEFVAKTKATNRNIEKQFVSEYDEIEPGTEWERIAKLCDFSPKATKSCNDVSRMRSIIFQLKQNSTAPSNNA